MYPWASFLLCGLLAVAPVVLQRLDQKRSRKTALRGLPRCVPLVGVLAMSCSITSGIPQRSALSVPRLGRGMSFHGGLIGVILVMVIFAKRTKRNFFGYRILSRH